MSQPGVYFYEPASGHGLAHSPLKSIIAPRPIGWISSQSASGKLNLAPYSFFAMFSDAPPIIGFSASATRGDTVKDSVANARATGEFCWNLVSRDLASAMNTTSLDLGPEIDEFAVAGLTARSSHLVDVPHVGEARTVLECRTTQVLPLTTASGAATASTLLLGEVVGVHIDESLLEDGLYRTSAAEPVLRGGGPGTYFTINDHQSFQMPRPERGRS